MDSRPVQEHSERSMAPVAASFNEDDSGSDVSASPSDIESSSYTIRQSPIGPDQAPASTPDEKRYLPAESLGAVKQRLVELDAVEDALVTKRSKLIAKRKRKDERIKSRFHEQDVKIKKQREEEDACRAQTRAAKEDRIRKRREREDAEYRKKEKAHDDEENELRRKLKNLKRGRPVDEEIADSPRASTISESMSPPAKKRQPNPPILQTVNSPPVRSTVQSVKPQQQDQPQANQYPYYYGWNNPPPVTGPYTYGPGEIYHHQNQPNPTQHNPLPSAPLPNGGPPRFNPPPPPPPTRHGPSPKVTPPPSHAKSPRHKAQTAAPPPPGPSHYDVRPPSATSNFTSINAAPSGFPSINQPPTHGMRTPIQPASKTKRAHQPSAKVQALALESAVHHSPTHPPGNSPASTTSIPGGKRKASTTHPYSQSEAFANRHHHCERTDELDRGIWTYFGPGGTKEAPTVAGKKEMYLRCNHDDCMRIDWKTVHGLQCHIVKNHGIPKGTIGSLELALEKYGVEIQEIEEHEKKHGFGSAGTMAEKGTRGRPRTRPSNGTGMSPPAGPTPGPTVGPVGPSANPAPAARLKSSAPLVLFPNLKKRTPNGGFEQDFEFSEDESDGDQSSADIKQPAPRHAAAVAQRKAFDSEFSTPSASNAGEDDQLRQSIPHSAPTEPQHFHQIEGLKSPDPRPRSSTDTIGVTDSAPMSTDDLPPSSPSSTKLPSHHMTQPQTHTQTQTPPMGTETQRIVSAVDRVNARRDAEDPDFVASTADSEMPPQTQTQTQTQTQAQTQTQTQPQTESPDAAISSTKNTSSTSGSASRPRAGAERRVPASERWDWAPIEVGDDNSTENGNSGSAGGPPKRRAASSTGSVSVLTKAQQELQGIDGSVAAEGEGEDGGGGEGGGEGGEEGEGRDRGEAAGSASAASGVRDESGDVEGDVGRSASLRSPATARYSARKKTRRRVDG